MATPTKTVTVAQQVEMPSDQFGPASLVGTNVLVFTTTYIYYGYLHAVNCDFLQLNNPRIVYETGPFNTPKFKDSQPCTSEHLFLSISHIETIFTTTQEPQA